MNEITRIHLGRTPYNIDLDAKKELDDYAKAIKKSLGDDADEIYDDIEIRMSEILEERGVKADGVITLGDVQAIRAQLGEPRDFEDDNAKKTDEKENKHDNHSNRNKDDDGKPRKKFYRDEDHGVLGGLAAGLAAYTGWDVVLWRIIFLILIPLTSGFAILAYIIMWVATPAAKTASEKLEMRGEPINLDSIKENARNFGHRAGEVFDDVTDKTADAAARFGERAGEMRRSSGRRFSRGGARLGHVTGRLIAILAGLFLLIVAGGTLVGACVGSFSVSFASSVSGVSVVMLVVAAIAGILAAFAFAMFCFILAIACFTGKFTNGLRRSSIISVIILMVAAIVGASLAGSWFATTPPNEREKAWSQIEKNIDPRGQYYVNEIEITASSDVSITYEASDRTDAVITKTNNDAMKQLLESNDTASTSRLITTDGSNNYVRLEIGSDWRTVCGDGCPAQLEITIAGPRSNDVSATGGVNLLYKTDDEDRLDVTAQDGSKLTVISNSVGYSQISADDKSTIDMRAAHVSTVHSFVNGSSSVRLGAVEWAEIQSDRCQSTPNVVTINSSNDGGLDINGTYKTMKNGDVYESDCLTVKYGAQQ